MTIHSFYEDLASTGKRQNCYFDSTSTERKSPGLDSHSLERCSAFLHPARKTTFHLFKSKEVKSLDEEKHKLRKRIELLKKETKRNM